MARSAIRELTNRSMIEGHLPVPGASLYFREVGSGTTMVVLHGGPDFNHNYLLPEMDRLSGAFRLVYYDQRGRGKSADGVSPAEVTIGSEVDDLDAVRRRFELDRMALLGHSWGSLLALEYAARHPDRVSHLVLMNPAPATHADLQRFRDRRRSTEAASLATMRALAGTQAYIDGEVEVETRYYRAHFAATVREPQDLERIVARLRSHFTPADIVKARSIEDRLYEQTWNRHDYDVLERLRGNAIRTLVLCAEHDFIPMECATHIAHAHPRARLLAIQDCGHFAYYERPDVVCQAIVDFFSRSREPASRDEGRA